MQEKRCAECIHAAECIAAKVPKKPCPGFSTKFNLQELKKIMAAKGLRPSDYRHLPYSELRKLAGV